MSESLFLVSGKSGQIDGHNFSLGTTIVTPPSMSWGYILAVLKGEGWAVTLMRNSSFSQSRNGGAILCLHLAVSVNEDDPTGWTCEYISIPTYNMEMHCKIVSPPAWDLDAENMLQLYINGEWEHLEDELHKFAEYAIDGERTVSVYERQAI